MLRYVMIRLKWKTGFSGQFSTPIVAKRISLFPEHQSGTNDFDTKENAIRYVTIWSKRKTGLKIYYIRATHVVACVGRRSARCVAGNLQVKLRDKLHSVTALYCARSIGINTPINEL